MEELQEFGLTENETTIYLLLLKEGVLSPGEVAEKLGMHRGYTYDALERMQEKQVVGSLLQKGKKHYQAADPGVLVEILQMKLEGFRSIVPQLRKMHCGADEETKVTLHKGRYVYSTLLKDIIGSVEKNDTVLLTGIDEEIIEQAEPIYLKQYLNIISRKKIREKIITKEGSRRRQRKNIEYREVSKDYIGNTAHIIYAQKVAIFINGNPRHMIFIENMQVAETYRKQFALLWKHTS